MFISRVFNTTIKAYHQIGPSKILKAAIVLFGLLGIGLVAKSLDFGGFAKWIHFSDDPDGLWYQGKFGYLLLAILFTAVGGPRQVVSFFAAYFFGLWHGFAISMVAVLSSCLIDAVIARIFEARVREAIRGKIDVAFSYWRKKPFSTSLILRLLPVGSNFLTNIAAGVTGIPLLPFLAGSALGYTPQMLVFSIMGTGVDVGHSGQLSLGIGLFVLLTIFGLWVYGRYRKTLKKRQNS